MIIFLWILMGTGVILTLSALILPFQKDNELNLKQNLFHGKLETNLNELKEQVRFLAVDFNQITKMYSAMHAEFYELKEKETNLIEELQNLKKWNNVQNEIHQLKDDNLKLQEKTKKILPIEQKNKELLNELIELTSNLENSKKEKERQENHIAELGEKHGRLQSKLQKAQISSDKANEQLQRTKKSELKLKENLLKQRALYSDIEKEAEILKEENQELKDGLTYELNN